MTKEVKDYVSRCFECNRNKSSNNRKYGLLQPLPIPPRPWHSLSMDFISQLLVSNGFDSILVIVDRFSKMSLFLRAKMISTSGDLAHLFIEHVYSKHGLPDNIVSDRGSLFVSSFWTSLCKQLQVTRNLSTAYHPESNGQTERVNQILKQYPRMYIPYQQDDWSKWLPLAEFAYNNSTHSSTNQSPFQTLYDRNPTFDSIHAKPIHRPKSYSQLLEIFRINFEPISKQPQAATRSKQTNFDSNHPPSKLATKCGSTLETFDRLARLASSPKGNLVPSTSKQLSRRVLFDFLFLQNGKRSTRSSTYLS
jgi:transposase InsO family protein